ncbi:MAG TPA: thiamine phosphate synthase [Hungateiclostridium thermocellum]|uniref:Thiamine-phosphate synthase n=3 Tax=Acetivibrio thermocellus TaxID=1515 RepID=A3DD07_ACET2|nr:thiamine phosphate synthase [Acetivibrio thermocellus]ADU74689.1 thiamine-phosphate pyrophosphorylase [Acetivibrio thermocellus DSM 1313]EIC05572.1 Thiamine-phosphate pyrophosphorylase [Acetivibrio thermocellus YS]CDG35291.1 thiamine-phosphate pyrophosphorylase [Acetivibrio thermocellus BC1]ABN51836.1 thiamine-phosphate pyrophosphorylase [Acetivibrio thermocellus ATCC 27405]ALX08632.1 Thiamine-phosphate pyrophosphorylase [Acetivibrio thermocellus AD2]
MGLDNLYRVLDANVNRTSEGLRVLEDLARFCYNDRLLSKRIKELRHSVRKNIAGLVPNLISSRDSVNDVGLKTSMEMDIDRKASLLDLARANFKRVQEALRTVEESLKVLNENDLSKFYESCRFETYSIEKEYFKVLTFENKKGRLNEIITGLYCITSEEHSKGRSNIEVVEKMIKAGVKIIQYREKKKSLLEKYNECKKIREMTLDSGVTFIVNDNIDIAMMVKADGVHIGQDDLPIEKVRELVGDEMIIGISTHSPTQAEDAVRRGADYIGVGPLYRTYTKEDVCEPVGLEYLDYVVKNINIPYVAIGGIKEHNMDEVLARGARCIAMVTEIVGADDIEEKISKVKSKFSRGVL